MHRLILFSPFAVKTSSRLTPKTKRLKLSIEKLQLHSARRFISLLNNATIKIKSKEPATKQEEGYSNKKLETLLLTKNLPRYPHCHLLISDTKLVEL